MRISWQPTDQRFVAEFNQACWHADKDLAKSVGFRCTGPDAGWVWYTVDPSVVLSLKGKPGLTVSKEAFTVLAEAETKIAQAVQTSRATNADVEIPAPAKLSYLPFQKAGIAYAMDRTNVLIADEMGLGKTIQAIGISNSDPLARRVLVICPSSLKLNWKKEFLKWDVKGLSVKLVSTGRKEWPTSDVVIINYDLLGKWQNELRSVEWDLMSIDECHYLKEGKTGRTQEVFGRKRARARKCTRTVTLLSGEKVKEKYEKTVEPLEPLKARRRIFLTGTPIVNRPKELWPLVQNLDPDGLGSNWKRYAERYCAGTSTRFGFDWSGCSNLFELQEKLRSRFMVRRLKKDVLKELPAKRRQVITLECESAEIRKIVAKENQTYEKYAEAMKEGEHGTPAFAEISRVRKETAVAKIPYVIDYLKEALDAQDKLCVFAHHHEVVDSLVAALRDFGVVSIDGRTPDEDREKAVEKFQTDPSIRVFVGTIKAAGVGLTLTASSTVVFAELDWVPGNVTQAEDRVHRIGQRNSVMIYHLVLEGSLDERMAEIIIDKQKVIDQALDTERVNAEAPILEISEATPQQEKPRKARSSGIIWRKDTEEVAPTGETVNGSPVLSVSLREAMPYNEEQTQAIHTALKVIAGVCDGAHEIDGCGFNKIDTNFGKKLATASSLTPKMAISGFNLVRKYQRQVPEGLLKILGIDKRKAA